MVLDWRKEHETQTVLSGEDKFQPKDAAAIEATEEKSEARSGQGEIAIAADTIDSAPTASTAAQVDAQLHNPSLCATSDAACVRAAYNEYKVGLLEEVDSYRELEDRVGHAFATRNDREGSLIVGQMMKRNLYRHLRWTFPTLEQMALTDVPLAEWDSLLSDCRVAAIDMKYLIVAIMGNATPAKTGSITLRASVSVRSVSSCAPCNRLSDELARREGCRQ